MKTFLFGILFSLFIPFAAAAQTSGLIIYDIKKIGIQVLNTEGEQQRIFELIGGDSLQAVEISKTQNRLNALPMRQELYFHRDTVKTFILPDLTSMGGNAVFSGTVSCFLANDSVQYEISPLGKR